MAFSAASQSVIWYTMPSLDSLARLTVKKKHTTHTHTHKHTDKHTQTDTTDRYSVAFVTSSILSAFVLK